MRFIYYYTGSVNGEDAIGHYIRSLVALTNCTRSSVQQGGCGSTFYVTQARNPPSGAPAAADRASGGAAAAAGSGARALLSYLLAP
jgi:hypothetical protein